MIFGILKPTAEEWLIFQRMRQGEHMYMEGFNDNPQTDPFTMTGRLARDPAHQGATHIDGRMLTSMHNGKWIVYDRQLNECVLTHDGRETLRLYGLGPRGGVVTKKPSER